MVTRRSGGGKKWRGVENLGRRKKSTEGGKGGREGERERKKAPESLTGRWAPDQRWEEYLKCKRLQLKRWNAMDTEKVSLLLLFYYS